MSYSATVIRVLIASPSDVADARQAISETINEWNSLHSEQNGKVLLPVMWESHSAPAMGDRPQEIINKQIVKDCDMLIGAFWTRLGTSTGVEESGTVEEIKHFLTNKKPVMLYHCKTPVVLDQIDPKQVKKLETFLKSIRNQGLHEQYSDIADLKQKLSRQLHIIVKDLSLTTVMAPSAIKAATSNSKSSNKKEKLFAAESIGKIWLEEYSKEGQPAKSIIIKGETKSLKEELKQLKGKWNASLGGWIFPISRKKELEDFIEENT